MVLNIKYFEYLVKSESMKHNTILFNWTTSAKWMSEEHSDIICQNVFYNTINFNKYNTFLNNLPAKYYYLTNTIR